MPTNKQNNFIRIAAVQIDFNPAALVDVHDYLKEPCKYSIENSFLLNNYKGISRTDLEVHLCNIKRSYIEFIKKKIIAILDFCAKKEVHIVVFPEYSIPAECLKDIHDFVKGKSINVIAGSHGVLSIYADIYETIGLKTINTKNDEKKAVCPIFHSNSTVEHVEKFFPTQRMDYDITKGTYWKVVDFNINSSKVSVAVFLCLDFLEDGFRSKEEYEKKDKIDLIIVPSYTPQVTDFETKANSFIIRGDVKKGTIPTVFVNASEKGGTKVFCIFDPRDKQQLYYQGETIQGSYKLPEGEEGIIVLDINPNHNFIRKITTFKTEDNSKQIGVYPFVYSNSIEDFEVIAERIMNCNDTHQKRTVINNNLLVIETWGNFSNIYKDKIWRLKKGRETLSMEGINFCIDYFYLGDYIPMAEQWRLKEIDNVIKIFFEILKKADDYEIRKEVSKFSDKYIDIKNALKSNALLLRRNKYFDLMQQQKDIKQKQASLKFKYQDKILWINNGATSRMVANVLRNDFIIENFDSDMIISIDKKCYEESIIIVICITSIFNPFASIKDIIKPYYNKCILVFDNVDIWDEIDEVKKIDITHKEQLKKYILEILNRKDKK